MLTSQGIRGIRKFIKATWAIKASPYQWSDETNRIVLKYQWPLLFWLLGVITNALNAVRSAVAFCESLSSPIENDGRGRMNFVLHLTMCSAELIGCLFTYNMICKRGETANCLNQLLTLNMTLSETFKDEELLLKTMDSLRKYQAANKIPKFLVPWLFNNLVLLWVMMMVDTEVLHWSLHLFSPALEGSPFRFISFGLVALAEALSWGPTFAAVGFYWFLYPAIFNLNVNYWLEFLGKINPALQAEFQNQRTVKAYKSLQVLMCIYNDCNSSLAWPLFMFTNVLYHVLNSFSLIKYREDLGAAVFFFVGWVSVYTSIEYIVYPISGRMVILSNELRRKWVLQSGTSKRRREFESLVPLGVKVGYLFIVDRMTSLLIVGLVANILLNCLLVF